jgi:Skp family chaperone for outer membrane proteins
MVNSRTVNTVIGLAIVLCIFAVMPSFAADSKSAGPIFASVDLDKLSAGYEKGKQIEDQLMAMQESLKKKLVLRDTNKMLTNDEFKQLVDLQSKATPTPEDTKKIDDILASSISRDKEFQALQQKPNATDADRTRMDELAKQEKAGEDALKVDQAAYTDQFQKKRDELQKSAAQEVDSAISVVAKEKGIALVFSKGVVLYSNNDITDDVVKKLNKK